MLTLVNLNELTFDLFQGFSDFDVKDPKYIWSSHNYLAS